MDETRELIKLSGFFLYMLNLRVTTTLFIFDYIIDVYIYIFEQLPCCFILYITSDNSFRII